MEKLVYVLWDDQQSTDALNHQLRNDLGPQITSLKGVHAVQLNLIDQQVANPFRPAQHRTLPAIRAVLQCWLDSSYFRQPLETLLTQAVEGFHGYAVVESQPIVNTLYPPQPGERTQGFSQMVFIERPGHLPYEQWLDHWLSDHTRVAIDTQSNFQYVQNIVQRALTPNAPAFHGIVEECFPLEALKDPMVFFDAQGNKARFNDNLQAMTDSCNRFLDPNQLDIIYTSQYIIMP